MKETTASFSSTSVSPDLLKLSENIHYLIGYQAAIFDKGERFRRPSSPEAKGAQRFIDELKRAAIFVRSLYDTHPGIDSSGLEKQVRDYVEARTQSAKNESALQRTVIEVGERLLGFAHEIRRKSKQVERLAA